MMLGRCFFGSADVCSRYWIELNVLISGHLALSSTEQVEDMPHVLHLGQPGNFTFSLVQEDQQCCLMASAEFSDQVEAKFTVSFSVSA